MLAPWTLLTGYTSIYAQYYTQFHFATLKKEEKVGVWHQIHTQWQHFIHMRKMIKQQRGNGLEERDYCMMDKRLEIYSRNFVWT